jgi:hypothetical protein
MVAAGVAAALGIAGLAWAMADARVREADAYARERAAQRRAVAATRAPEPPSPAPSSAPARRAACVTGLETFAVAIERALIPLPDGRARRVAALKSISDAAVRAERSAELGGPAPTLPRRMGLVDKEPVVPERHACDGAGFAEIR